MAKCQTMEEVEGSIQKARAEIAAILKENHKEITDGQFELQNLLSEVEKFTFNIAEVSQKLVRNSCPKLFQSPHKIPLNIVELGCYQGS